MDLISAPQQDRRSMCDNKVERKGPHAANISVEEEPRRSASPLLSLALVRTVFITLAALGLFAAPVQAQENRTITISSDSFAAIAYSPATGKYGFVYDERSRSAAEKGAIEKCGAEDARIAAWVNRGFCALALGSDKSCWGIGYSYGNGASTDKAKNYALADCRERTSGAHIAVVLSSDGQHLWDEKDHITVIDKDGNIYDGHGNRLAPSPKTTFSPSSAAVSPPPKDRSSPDKDGGSSLFNSLKDQSKP